MERRLFEKVILNEPLKRGESSRNQKEHEESVEITNDPWRRIPERSSRG